MTRSDPAAEAAKPSFGHARLLQRTIGRNRGVGKVLLLSAMASLTEGFGIVLLVPILVLLGSDETHRSGLFALLGTAPLWSLMLVFLLLVGLRLGLHYAAALARMRLELGVVDEIRREMHSGLLAAEWRWLSTQRKSDLVSMLVSQVGRIGHGIGNGINLLVQGLMILVYVSVALFLSWQTTLVAAGFGTIFLVFAHGQRRRTSEQGHAAGPLNREMHRVLQESMMAIRMHKVLGSEAAEATELDTAVSALRAAQSGYLRDSTRSQAFSQAAGAFLVAGVIWFGIEVANIGVPVLLPLLLVIVRLMPKLEAAHQCWLHWLYAAPAVEATNEMLESLHMHAEPGPTGGAQPLPLQKSIRLMDVSVEFAGRAERALHGINLALAAGTTTLIAGPSGAGKSTLADVLAGLIEPDQGMLTVDGVHVSGVDRRRWRRSVSYVEQDVALRCGTIRSNLLFACPSADEQALNAAIIGGAAEFAWKLPQGIDTEIGDDGVQLSGGERQRIALARALLGTPQLLILDEATNALDARNEAIIAGALARLRGKMTIVIISHGSAIHHDVDRVIRLEQGRQVSDRAADFQLNRQMSLE